MRTKLKSVALGQGRRQDVRRGEKVDTATVVSRAVPPAPPSGSDFVFMDSQDYEQHPLPEALVGDAARFLLEGACRTGGVPQRHVPRPSKPPVTVELEVTHTEWPAGRPGTGHPSDPGPDQRAAVSSIPEQN